MSLYPPIFSIWIYAAYRLISTVRIRTHRIILLCHRIHRRKPSQRRIIVPCPIIIPVQPFLRVQFLAVVLVRLDRRSRSEDTSEGVVMVRFLHRSVLVDDHTVVSLMVLQEVVVLAVGQGDISRFCQQQLLHTVFIDHVAAIVRCGGRTVDDMLRAELGSVGGIGVFNGASVRERDLAR